MGSDQTSSRQERALTVERIGVNRLPGISGSFELAELASGINLIVGPNASGKSRTAAAIHGLIWPTHAPARSAISGDLTTQDYRWNVTIDDRGSRYSREGSTVDPPELSGIPSTQQDRYLLTLQDLLRSDNKPLAEEIQRQSAGGYDLAKARELANFPKSPPKPRPRDQVRTVHDARADVRRLKADDEQLSRRESELVTIAEQIEEARSSQFRSHLLERALEYVQACEQRDQRRAERDLFPEQLSRMSGEEYREVVDLGKQGDDLLLEKRQKESARDEALRERDEAGFGDAVAASPLVAELRERVARIRDLEHAFKGLRTNIASLTGVIDRRRARIGNYLSDGQMSSLEEDGLRKLARLTRDFVVLDGEQRAEKALQEWVGNVHPPGNIDILTTGVQTLTERLRLVDRDLTQAPPALIRWSLLAAAMLVTVEAILLATEVSPEFAILALLALPIAYVALRDAKPRTLAEATRLEERYTALGLPEPPSWTFPDIQRQLEDLLQELAKSKVDEEKSHRWQGLDGRRIEAEAAAREVATESARLREELGVTVEDGDWEKLRSIADDLRQWQHAGDELSKAQSDRSHTSAELELGLHQLDREFSQLGLANVHDAVSASHRVSEVEGRMTRAAEASSTAENLRIELERYIQPKIDDVTERMARIFEHASVESGDVVELRKLCNRMEGFRKATADVSRAEVAVETTSIALNDDPTLRNLNRQEVETRLATAKELADGYDGLNRQRTETLLLVDTARHSMSLENSHAVELSALQALESVRQDSYKQAASWHLADFLHVRTRNLNRPQVFKEAQDLFVSFTSGQFELEFADDRVPTFKARDTSTNNMLDLDDLSSGTRVQLLMAVRIAFIETLEHGFRLPLLLDETLSNTDDVRINAIMDATLEISRRGRQIVYFTAQREEIVKWQTRITRSAEPVPHKVFDLAAVRGLAAEQRTSPIEWTPDTFTKKILPPDLDHDAAHAFFRVPALDPWAGHLNGADVWYFFTDVQVIARLRDHGVAAWGAYNALRVQTLSPLIAELDMHHARAYMRHRALEAALEYWRIGRCQPVDSRTLIESGALTPAVRNAILERAEEVVWDGAALIASLWSRKVPNIGPSKVRDLEDFLTTGGFIVHADPHPERVIRANALAAVGGELSEDEVDNLLRSMGS